MRFTKYGLRELILFGALACILMAAAIFAAFTWLRPHIGISGAALVSFPFVVLFALVLSFFRDPKRTPPGDGNRLLSPADGIVYDIGEVEEPDFIGGPALRIGIFLSIFDCHISRTPCSGTVEKIIYKKGRFFSALNANVCSAQNESNFVGLSNAAGRDVKIGVKQIAGQIARRIVCELKPGDTVQGGQPFGMIKFGSRTEIFIPKSAPFKLRVKVRNSVKAGLSTLGTFESRSPNGSVGSNE